MLPATCSNPPCMNIEVKIVAIGGGKSPGTAQAPVSPARDSAELEDERFRRPLAAHADRRLVEKDQDVQDDQPDRDERNAAARDVVLERDHRFGAVGCSTTTVGRVR